MRVFDPCEKNVDICKIFDEVFEEYEATQAVKRAATAATAASQAVKQKCANVSK